MLLSLFCVIWGGPRSWQRMTKKEKNNTTKMFFSSRSTALYQKRYNRDRKYRFKLQKQIEEEYEKHNRLEEILKTSGTTDGLKCFSGKLPFRLCCSDLLRTHLQIYWAIKTKLWIARGRATPPTEAIAKVMTRCQTQQRQPIPRRKKLLVPRIKYELSLYYFLTNAQVVSID